MRYIANRFPAFAFIIVLLSLAVTAVAQTEVMAWGNMTGIRVEGQLIEFESSFRVVEQGWKDMDFTGRERQNTQYSRNAATQTVKSSVKGVSFEQTVEDKAKGIAAVSITYTSDTTRRVEGVYYGFELPAKRYAAGSIKVGNTIISGAATDATTGASTNGTTNAATVSRKASGRQITISGEGRNIRLDFATGVTAFLHKEAGGETILYVQLMGGNLRKGQKGKLSFTVTASGDIDNAPVEVKVDRNAPGRLFAGLGGNFRLQNPANDPKVIDYCLDNMRVAFARVEMPWGTWQQGENDNPLEEARKGEVNPRVKSSMEMARRLAAKGMPVIVSAWFPPSWALAPGQNALRRGGIAALRLDRAKDEKIYKSLTDYLVYLKEYCGVEAWAFSFNESDLGINVLHTPEEHSAFIKGLGAYMASRGLSTKMLLGDNSDATTFDFIVPALNDSETHKYIAAVSFHSWRGCDDATLERWAGSARSLNVPLIVGEGSTDAAAWRYPQIFLEPTFALYEINLYVRIAAICQPLSILQWQLTSDYSLLWGGGIYGSEGDLRPTQRFWNLKQLAATPAASFALPFSCDREDVNCAAFGNIACDEYAVHIVNNGAGRTATISGLPTSTVKAYATNHAMSMEEIKTTPSPTGITLTLPPAAFVTLVIRP
ncbi:MAG: hypothetical protein LBI58_03275 [Tannerellaceae bacterium]|jgi:hypothetical protein|nr:hypothetical protein [Tannerellaceae bacterium]